MRSLASVLLIAGVAGLAAQTPASGPPTSVSGIVRDGTSRRPVAGVRVTIVAEGQGALTSATSGDDGRFVIENIRPGSYSITAVKPPYANGFFPESSSLRVDGRPIEGLELDLVPGAVITGQVTDPFGQPAAGAEIRIRRLGSPRLRESFAGPLGHWQTDENGRFRYFALAAGDYLISAQGLIYEPEARLGSSDGKQVKYAAVFYPDVVDPSLAQLVTVAPGQERAGVDIRLRLTGLADLSGVLTGPAEALARYPRVLLRPLQADLASVVPLVAFGSTTGSSFRVSSVPPGRYWLTAHVDRPFTDDPTAREKATAYWAAAEVVVGDVDVAGMTLALQPAMSLSGRVLVASADGATQAAPPGRVEVSITPTGTTPIIFDNLRAVSDSGDGFTIARVPPGQYRLDVRDWQVASVAVGPSVTTNAIVTVPADGLKDVVIVISRPK